MKNLNLTIRWKEILDAQVQAGFKVLRISSNCIPDLYLGINQDGYRCLLLFLPCKVEIKLKKSKKEKLLIDFIQSENIILIKLVDNDFLDLFDDLILSLYSKVEDIEDPILYSKELMLQFYKWAELFEDRFDSRLSAEEIKGLWGELFVLRELLEVSSQGETNGLLESWQGPYDKSNDFVFDDKNIEVKTKEVSKTYVQISSEFQLEQENFKGLELEVITVKVDMMKGNSLHDMIMSVVELIRQKWGDMSIFYRALQQKNLTIDNSKEYDNSRFLIVKKSTFDCSAERFPKLVKSNIPVETSNIKYKLQTVALSEFLLDEKSY